MSRRIAMSFIQLDACRANQISGKDNTVELKSTNAGAWAVSVKKTG